VKLAPYYSSFANFAAKMTKGGAAGLVLMNRFYQPDLDPDSREVVPSIELSQAWELRLPLRWVAILRSQLPPAPLSPLPRACKTGPTRPRPYWLGQT